MLHRGVSRRSHIGGGGSGKGGRGVSHKSIILVPWSKVEECHPHQACQLAPLMFSSLSGAPAALMAPLSLCWFAYLFSFMSPFFSFFFPFFPSFFPLFLSFSLFLCPISDGGGGVLKILRASNFWLKHFNANSICTKPPRLPFLLTVKMHFEKMILAKCVSTFLVIN